MVNATWRALPGGDQNPEYEIRHQKNQKTISPFLLLQNSRRYFEFPNPKTEKRASNAGMTGRTVAELRWQRAKNEVCLYVYFKLSELRFIEMQRRLGLIVLVTPQSLLGIRKWCDRQGPEVGR